MKAEVLFWDNVAYNQSLARIRAKPRHKNLLEVVVPVSPDEVLGELKKLGVELSRNTLLNYEKRELIPKADRGSRGKGKGRYADYPPETVAEAYASWHVIHGPVLTESATLFTPSGTYQQFWEETNRQVEAKLSPRQVAVVRKRALDIQSGNPIAGQFKPDVEGVAEWAMSVEMIFALDWLQNKLRVLLGVPRSEVFRARITPEGKIIKLQECLTPEGTVLEPTK